MKSITNRAFALATAMLGGIAAATSEAAGKVRDLFNNAYTAPDRWMSHFKRSRDGSQHKPNPKGHKAVNSKRLRHRREAPSLDNPHTLVARGAWPDMEIREQHVSDRASPYPKRITAQSIYEHTHGTPGASKKRREAAERRNRRIERIAFGGL